MAKQDWQAILDGIAAQVRPLTAQGRVATYIPALARVPSDQFAMSLVTADGEEFAAGDADTPFSIQSVSKVFNLIFALDIVGDDLWRRVGREPSGMGFNSLILLEVEGGVPRNPLINAGAIATTDAILEHRPDWRDEFLAKMQTLAQSQAASTDDEVFQSERDHGDLNRAIAWYLKAKGNLRCDPTLVTETYFAACATAMSTRELARAGQCLVAASETADPERLRRVRAIMRTCGLYDAAGDFAFRVGLPAKSGVGGGILAVEPGRYSVAVWSPALDEKGNSVAGVRALELLTDAVPIS